MRRGLAGCSPAGDPCREESWGQGGAALGMECS